MEANNMTPGGEYIYERSPGSDTVTVTLLGLVPLHSDCHANPHNRNGCLCAVAEDCGTVVMARPEQLRKTTCATQPDNPAGDRPDAPAACTRQVKAFARRLRTPV